MLPLQKPASERSLSGDAKEKESEVQFKYFQGFLRFLETVNRIRRPPVAKVGSRRSTCHSCLTRYSGL